MVIDFVIRFHDIFRLDGWGGGLDKCYVTLKNAIETQKKCKKTRNKRVNTSECYETDKEGGGARYLLRDIL